MKFLSILVISGLVWLHAVSGALPRDAHASTQSVRSGNNITPEYAAHAEALLRDSKCTACHAAKFATATDKTGNHVYTRKNRSVTSFAKLATQIARCDTELNLAVFDDDQATMARYLSAQFYGFEPPTLPSSPPKKP